MTNFLNNKDIIKLWKIWNKIQFSKLVVVNQMIENNIIIEFGINISSVNSNSFLKKINDVVIKKIPSGSVSFIGYLSQVADIEDKKQYFLNTQFKKYRIEFLDSFQKYSSDDLKDKINVFYNDLIKILAEYERK